MRGLAGRLIGAGKTIRKDFALARCLLAGEPLKHDVVAALRVGGAIPRSMESYEQAVAIASRELLPVIQDHVVGRPVRRENRRGSAFLGAEPRSLSIAAVFGREHEPWLEGVVVAHRPTVVAALFQQQHLFGGQRRFLIGILDHVRPVRVQLVTAVLSDEYMVTDRIDAKTFRIAYAGRVPSGGRKCLVGFLRVIAPDAAARLEFGAGIDAR